MSARHILQLLRGSHRINVNVMRNCKSFYYCHKHNRPSLSQLHPPSIKKTSIPTQIGTTTTDQRYSSRFPSSRRRRDDSAADRSWPGFMTTIKQPGKTWWFQLPQNWSMCWCTALTIKCNRSDVICFDKWIFQLWSCWIKAFVFRVKVKPPASHPSITQHQLLT